MDRNLVVGLLRTFTSVALRKESVDRNKVTKTKLFCIGVALRKESVDRNFHAVQVVIIVMQSLSARRAWIEMQIQKIENGEAKVALRKESVDRNLPLSVCSLLSLLVALRKESVDRNQC